MNAPGRDCTDTWTGFKPVASAVGLREQEWSRRQDSHPHWTRSELVASALGYAGKEDEHEPGADPAAPQGRSRINVRKVVEGLCDFAPVLAAQGSMPFLLSEPPRVLKRDSLEPSMAVPTATRFEPAFQLAQARRDGGIDFKRIPLPVSLDLELEIWISAARPTEAVPSLFLPRPSSPGIRNLRRQNGRRAACASCPAPAPRKYRDRRWGCHFPS